MVRLLGAGGMGQVYEAIHDQIKRRAAIKVLHKRFASNRQIVQRFINEARAVNMVQHANLVQIYEFGQDTDGSAYIVMEYLAGDTLRQRLEKTGGCRLKWRCSCVGRWRQRWPRRTRKTSFTAI